MTANTYEEGSAGVTLPADRAETMHIGGEDYTELYRKLDNWEHRSTGMVCRTCMWFVVKTGETLGGVPEKGRCRKRCPVVREGWPVVFVSDWCGDHKLG